MLDLKFGSQFKRDRRLCVKRGYDMDLLAAVVDTLLIYRVEGNELRLVRTGTHADLFGM